MAASGTALAVKTRTILVDDAISRSSRKTSKTCRAPQNPVMVVAEDTCRHRHQGLRFMASVLPTPLCFTQLVADPCRGDHCPRHRLFRRCRSDRALAHLTESGDTKMTNDHDKYGKVRATFRATMSRLDQNLYWSWIYSLKPRIEPAGDGYPQFMRSDAWLDKAS